MPTISENSNNSYVEDKRAISSDEELQQLFSTPGYENNNEEGKELAIQKEVKTMASYDEHIEMPDQVKNQTGNIEIATPVVQKETPIVPDQVTPPEQQSPNIETPNVEELIASAVAEERQRWENIQTSLDEYQKDPYAFYAKHSPHILQNFDIDSYVNTELEKEFGSDFVVDPAQIGRFGTLSNKYLRRQQELAGQAEQYQREAVSKIAQQEESAVSQLSNYKAEVMKKFQIADAAKFDQDIWNPINALTPAQVYDNLVELSLMKSRLDAIKSNIGKETPMKTFTNAPSIMEAQGGEVKIGGDRDTKAMNSMFSEDAFKNASMIR